MQRRWKVLLLISAGSFMAFLDAPVVSVAFPSIQRSFPHTVQTTIAWVLDGYFIGFAAFLVVSGKLADRLGRRLMFLLGMWLFTAASLVCALAPSVGVLIAGRVVQALGAAIVVPSGQGLMLGEFPAAERKTAIGVLAAIIGLGTALAPAVGGVVVHSLSWRWIFYLNVAGGVAVALWALSLLRRDAPARGARLPDAAGAVLQAGSLAFLCLAILKRSQWGWGDARTIGAFAVAAVALGGFLLRSARHPAPVVDFGLFRNRTFTAANLSSMVFAIGFYGTIITAVLYLTTVWHYSALQTGLAFIPGAVLSAAFGGPAGKLSERVGPRPVAVTGAMLAGGGLLWITLSTTAHPDFVGDWLPGSLFYSVGVVVALTGLVGGALTSAPAEQFALASGINAAIRQVGGAIGVALAVSITSAATPLTLVSDTHDAFYVAVAALFAGGVTALSIGSVREPADEPAVGFDTELSSTAGVEPATVE